jgi:hypothetical protein
MHTVHDFRRELGVADSVAVVGVVSVDAGLLAGSILLV